MTNQLIMVYSKMTKAVLNVERKKKSLALPGSFFAAKLQTDRMRYSMSRAVRPIAASSWVLPRCLRLLMTTL